jgi:sulfate/thiosulfate transport system permease protein
MRLRLPELSEGVPRAMRARGLPGVKIALAFTVFYLVVMVLAPTVALTGKAASYGPSAIAEALRSERVMAAFRLSFGAAAAAALTSGVLGLLVALVLARYDFPGKRIVDTLVDIPFALPTAVAGVALTTLYSEDGWLGRWFERCGVKVAFTPLGVTLALIFVGLPFVVRATQPVLADLEIEQEEAAASLGARPLQIFTRVTMPVVSPAWISGMGQAFARAVGEYGSVVFIAGNMPGKTEIAPLLIMTKLEQFDYAGATAIALVMLIVSFLLLLGINRLGAISHRRVGRG